MANNPNRVRHAAAVVPSDTVDLTTPGPIYVGVAGNLSLIPDGNADAAPIAFTAHPVGWVLDGRLVVRRVRSTGTTATGIVVAY